MKKIWKRVIASVLAIVLCAGVFVTTNWQTASAAETTDGLKVIGASIRFINEDTTVDGIRFAVGVKADALTDETKSNYHLLVMPTALLTDGQLEKGEVKINASTLYPHDIVHKYVSGGYWSSLKSKDATIEGLWKALPDNVQGCGNTIVVADGSGSMTCNVGNTRVTALDVANALAIYFAERSSGQFKGTDRHQHQYW